MAALVGCDEVFPAPVASTVRPRMECVVSTVVEKRLGALPVAAEFLRRLGLAGTADRLCPGRDIAHLMHGQVIETLVAKGLTAPAPLWRVDDWAREWAVEEVFGIEPELLDDDRLGRALDAIAEHLTELTDSIGARAIGEFGIDVSTCHRDMPSMSLHGAYPADDQDEDYPQVKHGHPKDRRYDLKQIQTGLAVTGDGGSSGCRPSPALHPPPRTRHRLRISRTAKVESSRGRPWRPVKGIKLVTAGVRIVVVACGRTRLEVSALPPPPGGDRHAYHRRPRPHLSQMRLQGHSPSPARCSLSAPGHRQHARKLGLRR
ncbi:DUF4277 domain-containing protein [Streptomyces sp. NPDC059949]|uniref:DUF4277 domain-containing protein n=1 Tax=Streptomyces sp. NPDC059949 TaxID=3347013 RepID=UPI0036692F45